jgi:hypothetical protein
MLPADVADLQQADAWDRYTIIAALDAQALTISGFVDVDFRNRDSVALDRLYFRLYPNHPDFGGRLDVTDAQIAGVSTESGTEHGATLFWIALPAPLAPGDSTTVRLSFVTRTPRNASRDTFGAHNAEAGVWAMANFYPILARYTPGLGWDDRPIESLGDFTVTDVGLYDVTIDAPSDWQLVATGVSISEAAVNDVVQRIRFVSGPQREFFLAALQDLVQISTEVDGTRIVSHYHPEYGDAGPLSLQYAEQALRIFNERYGRYPLAELDVVSAALTRFWGMEYPGIVLIEKTLYDAGGRDLEATIVHEIGHQWWYSLVGNDAQREPWLDEGLASYSQAVYYEELGNTAAEEAEWAFFRRQYRSVRDAGRDAPLAAPLTELRGRYVAIVYAKAALFFEALRLQLGDEMFHSVLHAYYAEHRYSDVVGSDLLDTAQRVCTCDLEPLYRDWVLTAAPVAIP